NADKGVVRRLPGTARRVRRLGLTGRLRQASLPWNVELERHWSRDSRPGRYKMARMSDSGPPMRTLRAEARRRQAVLIELTRRLVLAESPSSEKPAVDACMALAAERARDLGGRVKMHRMRSFGDALEARFGPRRRAQKPVLLLGHLDTVWPLGTLKSMPWRVSQGRLWGPGVLDMK